MKKIFILLFTTLFYTASQAKIMKRPERFNSYELVSNDNQLHGTITRPNGAGQVPIVILVAGSGPTDRNCNNNNGLNTNAYLKLADSLAMHGIACFRFDKRGVAKSADSTINESSLLFETYILDLKNWITKIKEDKSFSKIIIAGHSEGSLIGMNCLDDASKFISIAGAGESIDKILKKQLKGNLGNLEPLVFKQLDSLKNGKNVTCANPMLMSLFRPSVQPYMISWMKYNPNTIIAKIKKPILIIQGSKDLQVKPTDAQNLKKANPKANLVLIKNMNHILTTINGDVNENKASYNNPDLPLNNKLITEIVQFCKQ